MKIVEPVEDLKRQKRKGVHGCVLMCIDCIDVYFRTFLSMFSLAACQSYQLCHAMSCYVMCVFCCVFVFGVVLVRCAPWDSHPRTGRS